MKLLYSFLILFIIAFNVNAQEPKKTQATVLIDKLSWESLPITCNYALVLKETDSVSNELVKLGKPVAAELLTAIKSPEKSAAIHVILTRIYEPKKGGLGTVYIYKCKEPVGWHYVYNGLTWQWLTEGGDSISQPEIDKIYQYWYNKIILHKKGHLDKYEVIFERLRAEDEVQYPCEK
ncbi:hypothetical protein ACLI1A_01835 [Flavobacterium sp. RHBU_3]|uniref:hypothetical protein n=1 Tax=Flavobacterium sp. RHBU_3 TaxID=3391184 RepID=UPI003984FDE5